MEDFRQQKRVKLLKNKKPNVLAVIPAKKISRRLPNKNIRLLNGLPLICWTIEESLKSKFLTKICVSSDCKKTLEIASSYKSVILVNRPKNLCGPNIDNYKVVDHSLSQIEKKNNLYFDIILLLQPTSPIRCYRHIDQSVKNLWSSKCNTVASVKGPFNKSRDTNLKKIKNKIMLPWCSHAKSVSSMEKFYIYNASIYGAKREYFNKKKKLTSNQEVPILMDKFYSIDIDDIFDFKVAESYIKCKDDIFP